MEDLGQQDQFVKVILRSIADGVFTVDGTRHITSFNAAAERITGVLAARAIGKPCHEVFQSDVCESGCLLERTLRTGREAIDMPVNILRNDGQRVPISVSTAVLRSDDGTVLGAVETFRDLSTLEDLRKQLTQQFSFEDIITRSPAMLKLISMLPDVAESESTVLITGPSGSGKELFARAVHSHSPRRNKPLVTINCGTLPPQLFESELFGYVRGAFTDAKRDKPGKIVAAEGGTLFLDEVGELPMQTQVKLLRLLQQREYEPVGGVKTIKADIRVVAATNQPLERLVDEGRFRDDLFFRLAVIRLDLPLLRDRREDIPLLIDHFIRRFNARTGKNVLSVATAVSDMLLRHPFPGNVRELENVLEHAFALCHGRIIELDHLPAELLARHAARHGTGAGAGHASQHATHPSPYGDDDSDRPVSLPSSGTSAHQTPDPLQRAADEERRLRHVLDRHNGNRAAAARELGIHRTTLWRKLKQYGIVDES